MREIGPGDSVSPLEPTPEERAALRNRLRNDDPEAALIWQWFARAFHLNRTTAVAGDPHLSAINEGKRTALLIIADAAGCTEIPFPKRSES
jgi:hypothetical protein